MTYQRNYAYSIRVQNQRRSGGTIHANSMEEAVKGLISQSRGGLSIKRKESVFRPCDGCMIPQAEWLYNGEKAELLIWVPPEYF